MPIVVGGTSANTGHFAQITVRSNDEEALNARCAAIGIRVKGDLAPSDTDTPNWVLIKALRALGHGRRYVRAALTETDPPATDYDLLAPNAYARLRDDNIGFPRVLHEHIGEATEVLALRRAKQLLQAMLDKASRRTFKIEASIPDALAEEGDTVSIVGNLFRNEDWGLTVDDDGHETLTVLATDDSSTTLF